MFESYPNVKRILKHLIAPLFVGIILLFISKIETGHWWYYLASIPFSAWLLLLVVILLIVIFQLLKKGRKINAAFGVTEILPFGGWTESKHILLFDVWWTTQYPTPHPSTLLTMEGVDVEELNIKIPPLCPKCKTELNEKKVFLNKYLWSCVKCNFRKKSNRSYYSLSDDVLKIWKSELRNKGINNLFGMR